MQYIKVENNGYVNQVQADPRIIFDNHGQAYQVQNNQNHGFVNEIQTGPNHGYITQVQTGPNSYHGYINQVQSENSGYDNQDETEPNHGYITQVQTGPNSYHGYINEVQSENSGYDNQDDTEFHDEFLDETEPNHGYITQVQTGPNSYHGYINQAQENYGDVNQVQTGPKNHGYINHVQNGPTRGAEPGMLTHQPILKAVEAKSVPSKDLHTFRRPNPKVKMENQGCNNQVQTGPTRGAEPGRLSDHPILQAVGANPDLHTFRRLKHKVKMENQGYNNQIQTDPTREAEQEILKQRAELGMLSDHPISRAVGANPDLHTFRRPKPMVKMENQGYNNQIQTGDTGVAKPDMLKHIQILQAVEAKPVSSKDFDTFRRPYPRDKFEHRIEKRGM